MTYGSGLRVSEVVRVRMRDIDRGRMMLRVEQGKGHKDRYTVLSAQALGLLEELWRAYRPAEFFFTGQDGIHPICDGTAQSVYYAALRRSGVRRVGGIHVLRHCFATHLMEDGVDIYTIRRWMGHTSLVTTGRYMHVTREHLAKIKSPLDSSVRRGLNDRAARSAGGGCVSGALGRVSSRRIPSPSFSIKPSGICSPVARRRWAGMSGDVPPAAMRRCSTTPAGTGTAPPVRALPGRSGWTSGCKR